MNYRKKKNSMIKEGTLSEQSDLTLGRMCSGMGESIIMNAFSEATETDAFTTENLTIEELIKALRHCEKMDCSECPVEEDSCGKVYRQAANVLEKLKKQMSRQPNRKPVIKK